MTCSAEARGDDRAERAARRQRRGRAGEGSSGRGSSPRREHAPGGRDRRQRLDPSPRGRRCGTAVAARPERGRERVRVVRGRGPRARRGRRPPATAASLRARRPGSARPRGWPRPATWRARLARSSRGVEPDDRVDGPEALGPVDLEPVPRRRPRRARLRWAAPRARRRGCARSSRRASAPSERAPHRGRSASPARWRPRARSASSTDDVARRGRRPRAGRGRCGRRAPP